MLSYKSCLIITYVLHWDGQIAKHLGQGKCILIIQIFIFQILVCFCTLKEMQIYINSDLFQFKIDSLESHNCSQYFLSLQGVTVSRYFRTFGKATTLKSCLFVFNYFFRCVPVIFFQSHIPSSIFRQGSNLRPLSYQLLAMSNLWLFACFFVNTVKLIFMGVRNILNTKSYPNTT